jgi:hypothetical protein
MPHHYKSFNFDGTSSVIELNGKRLDGKYFQIDFPNEDTRKNIILLIPEESLTTIPRPPIGPINPEKIRDLSKLIRDVFFSQLSGNEMLNDGLPPDRKEGDRFVIRVI